MSAKQMSEVLKNAQLYDLLMLAVDNMDKIDYEDQERSKLSFELPTKLKSFIDEQCRRDGTTASGFLRECCRQLWLEYTGNEWKLQTITQKKAKKHG